MTILEESKWCTLKVSEDKIHLQVHGSKFNGTYKLNNQMIQIHSLNTKQTLFYLPQQLLVDG